MWWLLSLCQEVVRGYEEHDIPLDVLVTDMDWHVTFYKEADGGKKDQVCGLDIIMMFCITVRARGVPIYMIIIIHVVLPLKVLVN